MHIKPVHINNRSVYCKLRSGMQHLGHNLRKIFLKPKSIWMENPLVIPFQLLKIQPPTCKYIKSLVKRDQV